MILRNKKTGEIGSLGVGGSKNHYLVVNDGRASCSKYNSLAELNAEWEDYAPKQPLIKDEKIRKAVRAWAEANEYSLVKAGYDMVSEPDYGNVQIHFEFLNVVDEDKFGVHTIAELCGEEEE